MLEGACDQDPASADLRACLAIALAANFDISKALASLEAAIALDAGHFFARFKYAELFYHLRALPRAEEETRKALELADANWELFMARRQLQEIRRLIREDTQTTDVSRPLSPPVMAVVLLATLLVVVMLWQ